ncbi:unnamed protein product [Cuscuta campestris]|uniref:Uncharacterized protein n=1 Tax=Cuscuta campestris TaxID=132261 RepID=A0A484MEV5_9ASTE|nr:unnamed protein product [Cuscuta campestris]
MIKNNEVEYSLHSNKAFVFDLDISFEEVFNELLDAIGEDNLNSIKNIWGKYPKYKDGVYAASRPFPISEERTWRCFIQKATKEYDELEVYLDAHQVEVLANEEEEMEEEQNHQAHHHQVHHQHQVDEAGPSNTARDINDEDDSEDPTYVANSDQESSSDESEVSGWVSMYTPDVYTEEPINIAEQGIPEFPIPRHVEEVSLQPTFRIPEIQIGYRYGDFKSLQFAVALRNIAEHRHFQNSSKRRNYWLAKCTYPEQCPWLIQAAEVASVWTVKQYRSQHLCRPDLSKEKDDKLITSKLISGIIFSKIAADADYKGLRSERTGKKSWALQLGSSIGNWDTEPGRTVSNAGSSSSIG